MSAYLHHAARSHAIVSSAAAAVSMPVECFLLRGKAYVASRDPRESDHFEWLQQFVPDLKFECCPPESWPLHLQQQGPWAIRSLLHFRNDGIVSPQFFSECLRALGDGFEEALPLRSRLVEILLGEQTGGGLKVQGAVMVLPDGSKAVVTTDHLVLSLGPRACISVQPPRFFEKLAAMRLAGMTALEVAVMAPGLFVRWTCNHVSTF